MRAPVIVLLEVEEPYLGAFREWACHQNLELVVGRCGGAFGLAPGVPQLVVIGIEGDQSAWDRLRTLRKALRGCPVVGLARDVSVDTVVQLMRDGFADVIGLPLPPADAVARCSVHLRDSDEACHGLVGESSALQSLRREIAAVARTHSTVLITGETGSGKGVVAREIHARSPRRNRPLVHVDCAALAPSVIESELFGHERGSFTGAASQRPGRFELAADGTIFLDEIGELELPLQRKLLRVLEDREFERLGGTRTYSMAARVIAATNRDLHQAVSDGTFRADLLFRLNVFHLEIPPLRKRLGDLPALVRRGIERLREQLQIEPPTLDAGFYERLAAHSWPGNVRELMNLLERVMILHQAGTLDEQHLDRLLPRVPEAARDGHSGTSPLAPADGSAAGSAPSSERDRIVATMLGTGGNISRAARRLGVARSTLRYRLRRYGLSELVPRD